MRGRNQRGAIEDVFMVGVIGLVVLSVLFFVGYTIAAYANEEVRVCTVEDKDRAGRDGEMRVYTSECGNLKVGDAMFRGHFSASDVYREIEPGRTYEFTTIGFRVPLLSDFPNILSAQEVVE